MRTGLERIARAGWPVLLGVVLGLIAGEVWTLAQSDRYRAEARVLVRGTARGLVPAVRALAESSLLEQNVAQTLRLSKPPRVSATAGEGGVLMLAVEAPSRDRARQLDGEAALVLTQLSRARFGTSVEVTVLDPAHPVEQTSPTPGRNFLLAGLIGVCGGIAATFARKRRRGSPVESDSTDPERERSLRKRIDEVAQRERALAERAGELAARERAVEQRASEVAARERSAEQYAGHLSNRKQALEKQTIDLAGRVEAVEQQATELAGAAQALDEQMVRTETTTAPEAGPFLQTRAPAGAWTIEELEDIVRERRDAFPGQAGDWDMYLFLLREHATIDGSLPRSFDSLIADVFGDALERRHSTE